MAYLFHRRPRLRREQILERLPTDMRLPLARGIDRFAKYPVDLHLQLISIVLDFLDGSRERHLWAMGFAAADAALGGVVQRAGTMACGPNALIELFQQHYGPGLNLQIDYCDGQRCFRFDGVSILPELFLGRVAGAIDWVHRRVLRIPTTSQVLISQTSVLSSVVRGAP
jgi:hypothetical protein